MTIADSTPNSTNSVINSEIHLNNLETVLLKVDSLDELAIDSSNQMIKKEPPGTWSFITDWWAVDQSQQVRECLLEMLSQVNKDRESFSETSTGKKILDSEIKVLITEKFIPAGERYFDPLCLWRLKNIQNILAPKLKELRESKQTALKEIFSRKKIPEFNTEDDSYSEKKALKRAKQIFYKENPDYKMEVSIAKAELMYLLKIGTDINDKGATGSTIVSWFGKKKIAIFKPEDKQQFISEVLTNQFKYLMGWQISHFKKALNAQPKAEVAAHIIAEYFGLEITCPTKLVKLGLSKGSFQLWAQGMEEIQDIYNLLESAPEFHPKEVLFFQMMAALDFLLGNLDCHGGNCLIRTGKGGILIDELRKIDNANTFITHNTTRKMITDSKQYVWNSLKIAKEEFCQEAKEIMLKMTEEAINEAVEKIFIELPGYLNQDIITLLHQRAQVLHTVGQMDHYSPSELGQLQTDEEIIAFLHKNSTGDDEIRVFRADDDFLVIDDYPSEVEFKKNSDDSDQD